MKKGKIIILLICTAFFAASCGTKQAPVNEEPAGEATDYEELVDDMKKTAIANPWGDTQSLDVAQNSSGVTYAFPEDGSLPGGVSLKTYRYMEGTIEALYEGGENELCIRKSNDMEGFELAGDYNKYSKEWDEDIDGVTVHCRGDGELINVVAFDDGD